MERIILAYLSEKKLNFWELASQVPPMAELVKCLEKMEANKLVGVLNANLFLTDKGFKLAKKQGVSPRKTTNKNYSLNALDKKFLEKFKKFRLENVFNEKYDQLQLLPESVIKKVNVLKSKHDIDGKRIICLGDDDMVGIALALTKLPSEITVLDIDKDIIEYENEVFKKLKVKPKAKKCDLSKPIPTEFKNKYDVFITEPPDTVFGNSLFFSRGVECIKKQGGVGYIGVSETDFGRKKFIDVQKNILKMGGLITDVYNKIEPYEIGTEKKWVFNLPEKFGWPKKPWFYADLFRVEILEGAKPLFPGPVKKNISKELIETNIYC